MKSMTKKRKRPKITNTEEPISERTYLKECVARSRTCVRTLWFSRMTYLFSILQSETGLMIVWACLWAFISFVPRPCSSGVSAADVDRSVGGSPRIAVRPGFRVGPS